MRGSRIDDSIAQLGCALLVMHSPLDATVGIDSASRIFQQAMHPKSFVSLDQADHLLTRREDADYVAAVLSAWAGRYLVDAGAPSAPEVERGVLEEGVVEVGETGTGKFIRTIRSGRHAWLADEPRGSGGDDAGPSPTTCCWRASAPARR